MYLITKPTWIFQTQELNQDLLHCRWILYQLSYQGSPTYPITQLHKSIYSVGSWV